MQRFHQVYIPGKNLKIFRAKEKKTKVEKT